MDIIQPGVPEKDYGQCCKSVNVQPEPVVVLSQAQPFEFKNDDEEEENVLEETSPVTVQEEEEEEVKVCLHEPSLHYNSP